MTSARDRAELKRAVLTAPIWMQATKSSSRQVTEAVGVSQSFVVRTWREFSVPDDSVVPISALLRDRHMVPVGFAVGPTGSCLVLNPLRFARIRYTAGLSTTSRRRVRAMLAADRLRSSPRDHEAGGQDRQLWASLASNGYALDQAIILVSGEFPVPPEVEPAVRIPDAWQWQRLPQRWTCCRKFRRESIWRIWNGASAVGTTVGGLPSRGASTGRIQQLRGRV